MKELDSIFVSEKGSDHEVEVVDGAQVDIAGELTAGLDVSLTPEVAARIRRKIDWHLMPLMCSMYLITFVDKTTLGQSATLGLIEGAHLNQNQFDWLGTVFYLSYLVFEYPQNLALQRFPVGKWMSFNIFLWAVILLAHAACKSFGSLFAVRFLLGVCEGAITPGFMIVTSMFYTREEQARRVGYWFFMNGFAIIFLGFVAFGVLHTHTNNFMPWQWLMIITGALTVVLSVLFWFLFPDNPATAWFLTPEERVLAIQRIKVNQAGVENKHWKKEQFIEALTDPKTWVIALYVATANVINSITNQRQIIVHQFGFNVIQTTLIGCVDGVVEIIVIYVGVTLATVRKDFRGWIAVLMYVPTILGNILVSTLPSHNRVGLLFVYWICIFGFPPFVIVLGWVGSITAGHTKRTTTNAIVLIAYGLGNAVSPFMWKAQYQPRNHVPWAVISATSLASALLLLLLRWMLAAENKRRDLERPDDAYNNVFLVKIQADGSRVEAKVDKAFLDLTDRQNRDFRYVL